MLLPRPSGRGRECSVEDQVGETTALLQGICETATLPREVEELPLVFPCYSFDVYTALTGLIDILISSLGDGFKPRVLEKESMKIMQLEYCGTRIRYTLLPNASSILVEYQGSEWTIYFACSDPITFRSYLERLRKGDRSAIVARALAKIPLPADMAKLSENLVIVYAPYRYGDGKPQYERLLLGRLTEDYADTVLLGVKKLAKKPEKLNGTRAATVRFAILDARTPRELRRLILLLLGLAEPLPGETGLVLSKTAAEYVSEAFKRRRDNQLGCLAKHSQS